MESALSIFGTLDFLDFFLSFRNLGPGDLEMRVPELNGESVRRFDRPPDLVRGPSLAVFERGVGGLWRYFVSSRYGAKLSSFSLSAYGRGKIDGATCPDGRMTYIDA